MTSFLLKEGHVMDKRYRIYVEVRQITPITVVASSDQEARTQALQGLGEPGDAEPAELKIVRMKVIE